jgi:hypothetical protein
MSDSYVFAASLFYFVVLTIEIAAINLAAFGRDLFSIGTGASTRTDEISRVPKPPA